jgi:hypothetical protein
MARGIAQRCQVGTIEACANASPVGGIVEVHQFGSWDGDRRTLVLAIRSEINLARLVTALGTAMMASVAVAAVMPARP